MPNSEAADEKQMHEALRVLNSYYTRLAREMSAEIVEERETFEAGSGSSAHVVIEKYAEQIRLLGSVYHLLKWKAPVMKKPEGLLPLAKTEFRCFSCGAAIKSDDAQCRICGWTWN